MSDLTRIDQYICIDVEQIVLDEMQAIVDRRLYHGTQEEKDDWAELQQAATIILKNYRVC